MLKSEGRKNTLAVFNLKNSYINGPVQFKPVLFKVSYIL